MGSQNTQANGIVTCSLKSMQNKTVFFWRIDWAERDLMLQLKVSISNKVSGCLHGLILTVFLTCIIQIFKPLLLFVGSKLNNVAQ